MKGYIWIFLLIFSLFIIYNLLNPHEFQSYTLTPSNSVCYGGIANSYPCINSYDGNWDTFTSWQIPPGYSYVLTNFTIPKSTKSINLTIKLCTGGLCQGNIFYWNYTQKDWSILGNSEPGLMDYKIPKDGIKKVFRIKVTLLSDTERMDRYYESKIDIIA